MDPFRLEASVLHADGSITRWAADEIDPENKAANISFGTQNPGGFGAFGHTLPRGLEPGIDENLLDTVTYKGPGGQVAYEGRVHRLPRSQGDDRSVTVQGVGWSSHLSDFRAFQEVYRDCLMASWSADLPLAEKARLSLIPWDWTALSFASDTGGGFTCALTDGDTLPTNTETELWYAAPAGVGIGRLMYQGKENLSFGGLASRDVSFSHVDSYDGTQTTTVTNDDTARTVTVADPCRYAHLRVYSTAGGSVSGKGQYVQYNRLAVYGNHGLTVRGTEPLAGFYASDIIGDVISRAAPLLRVGTLEDPGFIIPQSSYTTPTTAADVILDANKTGLYDWFVWEDREFTIVNPDPNRLTWNARVYGQGANAKVNFEGDDVIKLASSCYVFYQDEYGRSRVYGPTGADFADNTSDLLLGDGLDPYTLHGIDAPLALTLSDPVPDHAALEIGRVWLAEQNAPVRSGQITVSGFIGHPSEGDVPCWRVRAGDFVRLVDRTGDVARKVVSTQYDHQTRTNTLTMQSGPLFRAEGLLARLAVQAGVLG